MDMVATLLARGDDKSTPSKPPLLLPEVLSLSTFLGSGASTAIAANETVADRTRITKQPPIEDQPRN